MTGRTSCMTSAYLHSLDAFISRRRDKAEPGNVLILVCGARFCSKSLGLAVMGGLDISTFVFRGEGDYKSPKHTIRLFRAYRTSVQCLRRTEILRTLDGL